MNLKIERLPIESLTFDPANARKHSEANLSAIEQSLRLFGQRKPIVITSNNFIVAGNGTVEAASRMGITDLDVVRVPKDWTAEQITAFALADNRTAELAEWNPEVLASQLVELESFGFVFESFGFPKETTPYFEPIESDERLDVRTPKFCPGCGYDITGL